jgi:hypothetical protein
MPCGLEFFARDFCNRRSRPTQKSGYIIGTKPSGKTSSVTVEAEDAMIAALKAKQQI